MSLRKLSRSIFSVWFAVFALMAAGLEQNQLAASVQWALLNDAAQARVAGLGAAAETTNATMPADCPMRQATGHTHRGHADCPICGAEMALAALILPFAVTVHLSGFTALPRPAAAPLVLHERRTPRAYAPRAPPALNI